MTLDQILDSLRTDPDIAARITVWREVPPRSARWASFPTGIDPLLTQAL